MFATKPHVAQCSRPLLAAGIGLLFSLPAGAEDREKWTGRIDLDHDYRFSGVRIDEAVHFAEFGDDWLALDLFRPTSYEGPLPLIVFIHGGGWMTGLRFDIPREIIAFTDRGYAVATIDYRLSSYDRFPANVHDVKAAVRFLRANAGRFDLDPGRIALVGMAAGGHLATLAGIAISAELEGTLGDHAGVSSAPQAIVSLHGPMNMRTILRQETPTGSGKHRVPVELMLGGAPERRVTLAILASPVEHVRRDAPPLLIIHGEIDDQVPVQQAREMHAAYRRHEADAELIVVEGADHRAVTRFDARRLDAMSTFLARHLALAARETR